MNNTVIKILIVDDEAPARTKLSLFVETDKRFLVVGEAKNGQEALEKIVTLTPDLLLLDIQMPGMTGFDVLRLMGDNSPAIIFTTAYDEYAVQAFEVSAIDYLLKPISEHRLQQALEKMINLSAINWDERVSKVLQTLKHKQYAKKLAVKHMQRVSLLNVDKINFIVSEHRLINIYNNNNEKFWTNENLTQLEARLDPNDFMRIQIQTCGCLFKIFHIDTRFIRCFCFPNSITKQIIGVINIIVV